MNTHWRCFRCLLLILCLCQFSSIPAFSLDGGGVVELTPEMLEMLERAVNGIEFAQDFGVDFTSILRKDPEIRAFMDDNNELFTLFGTNVAPAVFFNSTDHIFIFKNTARIIQDSIPSRSAKDLPDGKTSWGKFVAMEAFSDANSLSSKHSARTLGGIGGCDFKLSDSSKLGFVVAIHSSNINYDSSPGRNSTSQIGVHCGATYAVDSSNFTFELSSLIGYFRFNSTRHANLQDGDICLRARCHGLSLANRASLKYAFPIGGCTLYPKTSLYLNYIRQKPYRCTIDNREVFRYPNGNSLDCAIDAGIELMGNDALAVISPRAFFGYEIPLTRAKNVSKPANLSIDYGTKKLMDRIGHFFKVSAGFGLNLSKNTAVDVSYNFRYNGKMRTHGFSAEISHNF
jgi:hypothetical protein